MGSSWREQAAVWLNDPNRGRVLVGTCGFAWWTGRKVYVAPFRAVPENPISAYKNYMDWNTVRTYPGDVPTAAVVRFVRTGLYPV